MRERARGHEELYKGYKKEHVPDTPQPAPYDSKWRYFYRIGEHIEGRKDEMDYPNVIP